MQQTEFETTSEFGETSEFETTSEFVTTSETAEQEKQHTTRIANLEGMQDILAKDKLRAPVHLALLMLSLIPEYAGYDPQILVKRIIELSDSTDPDGPQITELPTELGTRLSKDIRLDVHTEIRGIPFKPKSHTLEGKSLQVENGVKLGLSIHLDLEPQSSTQTLDVYLKRCAYYLAAIRLQELSSTDTSKPPEYTASSKSYTIWFSKTKLAFTGEYGVYHAMMLGNTFNPEIGDLTNTRDVGLEEIFIISMPTVLSRYVDVADPQRNLRSYALYTLCKNLSTHADTTEIKQLESLFKVIIEEEGGIPMFSELRNRDVARGKVEGRIEGEIKGKITGKIEGKIEAAIKMAKELKSTEIPREKSIHLLEKAFSEVFEEVKPEILKIFED